MDLLKAEIAKKRNYLESNKLVGDNKYFKRSALREQEEKEYLAKSKRNKDNSEEQIDSSWFNKNEEENLLLKKFEERSREEREKGKLMPRKEVVRILRERNQPIRLFGESDYDTFQRLKRLQLLEPESKGMRNDLIAALDKVDDAEDEEFYSSGRGRTAADAQSGDTPVSDVKTKETVLDAEEIERMKMDLARFVVYREGTATDDATSTVVAISKLTPVTITAELEEGFREKVTDHVLRYLKFLLSKWGHALNARPKEEKLSYSGKIASATYTQTVEYVKTLLRALQERCCRDDILDSLVKIITLMMDGNYLKANDAYLELAIGNAPWPLGVTNHGIHSRTAQEKIHAKNVAHVLNDETQRKYIQAIKRLMTQCQKFFPSDPSKCVNYMGSS
ncbi:Pre-mRNA-splicing factor [Paragonimus heterotremus]|uniref:Pre-mRNA-splicing factor 18 n=1 Tax=Paragonimus heterotremus TaxID=100268 RepID=A0A8J4WNS2_9TREM|nr:Pre-mRNA-splicing factor [Paragonimus heterotremus]